MSDADMNSAWLNNDDWAFVQARMPITCVDVLPVRLNGIARDLATSVGLIFRETPDEGCRWCLIGGRLLRNESLREAVKRQVREALGHATSAHILSDPQPNFIIQYFTEHRAGSGTDRRQHAIGLTYCVSLDGDGYAQGEALDFAWFNADTLPDPDRCGFGQYPFIRAYLVSQHE